MEQVSPLGPQPDVEPSKEAPQDVAPVEVSPPRVALADVAAEPTRPTRRRVQVPDGCPGCETPPTEQDRCEHCGAARRVGRYSMVRVLSHGPHGRVYDAYRDDGERVALKELSFALAPDAKTLDAFDLEAEFLRALDHPQIPKFIESFREGEGVNLRLYLAQEFVEGETLAEQVAREPFSSEHVQRIAKQVLQILEVLHSADPPVLHRDLKPSNLILTPDGMIALVDFGAARLLPRGETHGSTLVGTFGYMPPEQLGGTVDPSSDLYALGATLMHLLTGRPPEQMTRDGLQLDVDQHLSKADARLRRVIKRLVMPDRRLRYSTATSALEALWPHTPSKARMAIFGVAAVAVIALLPRSSLDLPSMRPESHARVELEGPSPFVQDDPDRFGVRWWDQMERDYWHERSRYSTIWDIPNTAWLNEQIALGRAPAELAEKPHTAQERIAYARWKRARAEEESQNSRAWERVKTARGDQLRAWYERIEQANRKLFIKIEGSDKGWVGASQLSRQPMAEVGAPAMRVSHHANWEFPEGKGAITVAADRGAEVRIDGELFDADKLRNSDRLLPLGMHLVQARLGAQSASVLVRVGAQSTAAVLVDLESLSGAPTGQLALAARVRDARILVDGFDIGREPPFPPSSPLVLPVGPHHIEARSDRWTEERWVIVRSDDIQIVLFGR